MQNLEIYKYESFYFYKIQYKMYMELSRLGMSKINIFYIMQNLEIGNYQGFYIMHHLKTGLFLFEKYDFFFITNYWPILRFLYCALNL